MSEELSLSEELRRAREGRGESLDQVHQRTGISVKILQALEDGDLEAVEAVYMRMGAIHYATYLGLDGQALAQGLGGPRSKERVRARMPPPWGGPVLGDGLFKWAAGLAVVAIAALLYLMTGGEANPAPPAVPVVDELPPSGDPSPWEEPAAAESPEPVESGAAAQAEPGDLSEPVEGEAPESDPEGSGDGSELARASPPEGTSAGPGPEAAIAEAASPARIELEAEAFDTVWVQVSWDDVDSAMETISAGERRTWTAERYFRVHAGRSGNIRFRFQGQLLGEGRLGDPDRTLRFRVSDDGYQLLGPDFQPIGPLTGFPPERTESSQSEAR